MQYFSIPFCTWLVEISLEDFNSNFEFPVNDFQAALVLNKAYVDGSEAGLETFLLICYHSTVSVSIALQSSLPPAQEQESVMCAIPLLKLRIR